MEWGNANTQGMQLADGFQGSPKTQYMDENSVVHSNPKCLHIIV